MSLQTMNGPSPRLCAEVRAPLVSHHAASHSLPAVNDVPSNGGQASLERLKAVQNRPSARHEVTPVSEASGTGSGFGPETLISL